MSDADSALSNDHVIDTLHVVARTPGVHATYYYRTLLGTATGNGGTEWTPWQKIDVDIQSDGDRGDVHMVLTTYNRRLYLFWAIFAETPEPSQPGMNQGDSPPPPLTHWDIRLALVHLQERRLVVEAGDAGHDPLEPVHRHRRQERLYARDS